MISNSVSNIKPVLNSVGFLTGLEFVALSKDESDGEIRQTEIKFTCAIDPNEDGVFDQKELEAFAVASPEAAHAFVVMRAELLNRKVPVFVPPVIPELTLDQHKQGFMARVDNFVGNVTTKYTRFQMGYVQREAAAQAYVESNFEIAPTIWITSFADRARIPYTQAAQIILTQASALRHGVEVLEDLRMRKYEIQYAATRENAEAIFTDIMKAIDNVEKELP